MFHPHCFFSPCITHPLPNKCLLHFNRCHSPVKSVWKEQDGKKHRINLENLCLKHFEGLNLITSVTAHTVVKIIEINIQWCFSHSYFESHMTSALPAQATDMSPIDNYKEVNFSCSWHSGAEKIKRLKVKTNREKTLISAPLCDSVWLNCSRPKTLQWKTGLSHILCPDSLYLCFSSPVLIKIGGWAGKPTAWFTKMFGSHDKCPF